MEGIIDNVFNKKQYELYEENYLTSNQDQHVGGSNTDARVALLQKYLPVGRRVFEIGSAGGVDAEALQKVGYKVTTSDFVDAFVKHLQKKGLRAVPYDAKSDQLPETTDTIYSNAVFVHFTDEEVRAFLQKAKKNLENEKLLFLTVIRGIGIERSSRNSGFDRDFHYYKEEELVKHLQEEGFSILHQEIKDDKWIQIVAKVA